MISSGTMNEDENETCPTCDELLVPDGFEGDYRRFVCSGDCETKILRLVPGGSPGNEGITAEGLQNLKEFNSDE